MKNNIVFWNVDTQQDFMYKHGALYVPGAETIIPALALLTRKAQEQEITVVNTADRHTDTSKEFVDYPPHCLIGSLGGDFIPETSPDPFDTQYLMWDAPKYQLVNGRLINPEGRGRRNTVIFKDHVNAFIGNKYTEDFLKSLLPIGTVVVYGVATDICVTQAVNELMNRDINVIVVKDAIKGLTENALDDILISWRKNPYFQGLWNTQEILDTLT